MARKGVRFDIRWHFLDIIKNIKCSVSLSGYIDTVASPVTLNKKRWWWGRQTAGWWQRMKHKRAHPLSKCYRYFLLSYNWGCSPKKKNYICNIIPCIHFIKYFKMCFCFGPPTQNNEEISLVRNSLRKINLKIAWYAHWVTRISAKRLFFIYFASENCKSHTHTHKRQTDCCCGQNGAI